MEKSTVHRLEDAQLIELVGRGSREGFGVLLDRYESRLAGFTRALSGRPDMAEDALQEAFVAVWRGAATYRGDSSPRSWLFNIARNAVHRQYRKRAGEPRDFDSLEELGRAGGWGVTDDNSFSQRLESQLDLEKGFAKLNSHDREIIYLVDVEGLTHEEAGRLVGVGGKTVKTRVHRARLRLMGALREADDE